MKITYSKIPKAKIKTIKYKRIDIENIVEVQNPITRECKFYDRAGHLIKYVAVKLNRFDRPKDFSSDDWGPECGFVEIKDDE